MVTLQLLIKHLLSLILAHQLCQSAVELSYIMWEELFVSEDLMKKFLLVFLSNEATFDSKTLVCDILPTSIEDLLGPDSSQLLLLEPSYLLIPLNQCQLPDFPVVTWVLNLIAHKKHLILTTLHHPAVWRQVFIFWHNLLTA